MAVALEFIDLVVPIVRIKETYPGGWDQCLLDYASLVGRRVWYDQHLFRDGAMGPEEMKKLVEGWAVLGFEITGARRARLGRQMLPYWKDVCVVDWQRGGPTLPCNWLRVDSVNRTAQLAATEPGPLAWRERPRAGEPL